MKLATSRPRVKKASTAIIKMPERRKAAEQGGSGGKKNQGAESEGVRRVGLFMGSSCADKAVRRRAVNQIISHYDINARQVAKRVVSLNSGLYRHDHGNSN
jgi:hypothetical protein